MTSGAACRFPQDAADQQALALHLWPASPHDGRGRRHGTSRLAAFDRWFRYPAGFATDYVEHLLGRVDLKAGDRIIDCFAGSGVTGTASRAAELGFVGIEAHPMIAELANAKLQPSATSADVSAAAAALHRRLRRQAPKATAASLAKTPELVKRSFDIEQLEALLRLRDIIRATPEAPSYPFLKWALLGTLRDVANVKVGWPYQRPSQGRRAPHANAQLRFFERLRWMAADLATTTVDGQRRFVVHGDARDNELWANELGDGALRACISSPPYLNNFDYADATRLEAYFWGSAASWAELCSEIRTAMLTASTQQSSRGEKRTALEALATASAYDDIAALTAGLQEQRAARKRGKEYDQVVPAYFNALNSVLANLSEHLDSEAPVLWLIGDSAPYGVYVDTPGLLGRLATDHGFTLIGDVVLRERGNRWGSAPGRHQQALTERLLVLEAPAA